MFKGLFKKIDQLITGRGRIDDDLFDDLEELLIQSDVGVHTATRIGEDLREAVKRNRLSDAEQVREHLRKELSEILSLGDTRLHTALEPPTVYLMVGVNGTGKTTTTAK